MIHPLKNRRERKHQEACERANLAWRSRQYEVLSKMHEKYDIVLKPKVR